MKLKKMPVKPLMTAKPSLKKIKPAAVSTN